MQCVDNTRDGVGVVPCSGPLGVWSQDKQCYVQRMEPQPPPDSRLWGGRYPQGAVYSCVEAGPSVGPSLMSFPFWADSPPAVEPPPDPQVLAQMAVESMGLRAIEIGIAPDDAPGSIGVVGMPVWMWVSDPQPSTWGPITRTASLRGYSVTATARVDRVEWSMGDGTVVTCRSPGTPYRTGFGIKESPDCGHVYAQQGDPFGVSATSFWSVAWSGIGQSGVIPLTVTADTSVVVGEVQVLVQ